MAIHFNDLPNWAQKTIHKTGTGMAQVKRNGDMLQVSGGTARFNGKVVVYGENPIPKEDETILFGDLPQWAQEAIRKTGTGMAQVNRNGDMLQISGGQATFNGKKVTR